VKFEAAEKLWRALVLWAGEQVMTPAYPEVGSAIPAATEEVMVVIHRLVRPEAETELGSPGQVAILEFVTLAD
jgi:hypothetical protein